MNLFNSILKNAISTKLSIVIFFIFPIFLYAIFATNFTFDFFQPYFLWKGYNYYFLAVINGHLDVPAHAIGREASYIGDKVYMYYGALPLMVRALLYPFMNLEQTSVSAFSVFIFSIIGQVSLQYALLMKFKARIIKNKLAETPTYLLIGFVVVSAVLWFGSATFVIVQNATLYHEPYAASLCLINMFLALLIKDDFLLGDKPEISLTPYAVLAALCIHARMPTALALYSVMVFLLIVQTYRLYQCGRSESEGFKFFRYLGKGISTFYLPLLILFLGGVSILWLNYARFDDALAFMGKNYGYFFFEGYSDRQCNLVPKSDFAGILRIIPNTVVYLTSSADLHWSLTWHLKTGFGRLEAPSIPLAILWLMPLLMFMGLVLVIIKRFASVTFKYIFALFLLFSIGALFQLSYPTIAHRYSAELWLPLAFSIVFLWSYFTHKAFTPLSENKIFINKAPGFFYVFVVSALMGLSYQFYLSFTEQYYLEDGPIYIHENYHYSQEDVAYLSSLNAEKIKNYRLEYKANKKKACDELAEKNGLKAILEKSKN